MDFHKENMKMYKDKDGEYINGRNSANLRLLIDKTSSIYLYVKLKVLAS
jgi:hypothetical protein